MANLKQWIEESANGEPIEAVLIGEMGWGDYRSDGVPQYEQQQRNVPLSWEEAAPMLDYEFNSGYGAPGCNAVYAYTASRVIFIVQYDGSTRPVWIPRHPVAVDAVEMPGG